MIDYFQKKQRDREENPRKEIEITMTKGSFLPKESLEWFQFHFPQSSTFDGFFQICYRGASGFRTLWTGLQDNVEEFLSKMKILSGSDYYITPNCCTTIKRQKEQLFALQNVVIDVDCHEESMPKEKRNHIIALFCSKLEQYSHWLPLPHSIVWTGRGLQLWWAIQPIHAKILHFYNQVKQYFIACLEHILKEHRSNLVGITVDHVASNNAVGVFRLPGSSNPKARCKVRLERTKIQKPYLLQELEELAKTHWKKVMGDSSRLVSDPDRYKGKIMRDGMADVAQFAAACQNEDLYLLSGGNSFSYFRTKQLLQLFQLRDKPKGVEERNNFSLLMYSAFRSALTHEESWERLQRFNQKFKQPLTLCELENVICSAKHQDGYRFSNKKVIDFLHITTEEKEAIGLYEKNDSFAINPKKNAFKTHFNQVQKAMRNRQIQELLSEKKTAQEIATELSISVSTVNRITREKREEKKVLFLKIIQEKLDQDVKFQTIVKNDIELSQIPKGSIYRYRNLARSL